MKPMLSATVVGIEQLDGRYPLLASPKLDGIRALKWQGVVVSRNLKPIPNKYVQQLLKDIPNGLDGELIVGDPTSKTCFRDTSSGCMSEDGEPKVVFYIFDIVDKSRENLLTFEYRFDFVKRWYQGIGSDLKKHVKLVPQKIIKNSFELYEYESTMLERGYEGVMLRSPEGIYKFGRSTLKEGHLMKLKRFKDSEAKILAVEELMHNNNEKTKDELGRSKRSTHKENLVSGGTLGSLSVKDIHTGVTFDVGSGFTQADRDALWKDRTKLKGKVIKYKYFPTGSKDKPRFPVFLGFRDKIDI